MGGRCLPAEFYGGACTSDALTLTAPSREAQCFDQHLERGSLQRETQCTCMHWMQQSLEKLSLQPDPVIHKWPMLSRSLVLCVCFHEYLSQTFGVLAFKNLRN